MCRSPARTKALGELDDGAVRRKLDFLLDQHLVDARLLDRANAVAGDRVGAIEQASIYEALIEEDVELPPDRAVVDFAARLRAGWIPGHLPGSREQAAPNDRAARLVSFDHHQG